MNSTPTETPGSITQPNGFLALPDSGEGPPVLVLHPWWGLNGTIRDVCTRLAREGFVAFAPDLYAGQVADTIEGAEALSNALDGEGAEAEVEAAARFLLARTAANRGRAGSIAAPQGLAVIGFSLGANFALWLSEAHPELVAAVVLFYGTGPTEFSRTQADYLGHFAADDPYEERVYVDALEGALRSADRAVTFHHYPDTGHWFFEPDRADAFHQAAADLAWERTLAFLRRGVTV